MPKDCLLRQPANVQPRLRGRDIHTPKSYQEQYCTRIFIFIFEFDHTFYRTSALSTAPDTRTPGPMGRRKHAPPVRGGYKVHITTADLEDDIIDLDELQQLPTQKTKSLDTKKTSPGSRKSGVDCSTDTNGNSQVTSSIADGQSNGHVIKAVNKVTWGTHLIDKEHGKNILLREASLLTMGEHQQ